MLTYAGKLIYPAALLCIIHDLAYGRQVDNCPRKLAYADVC